MTDDFIGEGSLTFQELLACCSPKGATLVTVPSKMVALRDWKGRPMKSQVQLKVVCTATHHRRKNADGRDAARMPVADVEKAYDALLGVAWRENENTDGEAMMKSWQEFGGPGRSTMRGAC